MKTSTLTWEQKLTRAAESWRTLLVIAPKLNRAKDEYRTLAERIAGCSLSDWSMEEIERYVRLGLATVKENRG